MSCSKLSAFLATTVQSTQLGTSLVELLAWQTLLPAATADDTSLYIPSAVPTGIGGSYAETQTNIRLASYLVRAPYSLSGGLELYKK